MIKIVTKRSELEEEALREEGRAQQRREDITYDTDRIYERQYVDNDKVNLLRVQYLIPGDYIVYSDGPRSFYRGERVTENLTKMDAAAKGITIFEGLAWLTTESIPRGGRSGYSMDPSQYVLVERKPS